MSSVANQRWIGVSAIVAAAVSAVAFVGPNAGAASTGDEATFVPIPPCRIIDTRPEFQVGPRSTPVAGNETHELQVTGVHDACTIPDDAKGISLNVTAVNPTAPSFMTVFPFDAPLPLASNLNYLPGGAPTPNKVDVKLSATGAIGIYNLAGTVDVVADVGGYYTDAGIQEILSDLETKANSADVYTKLETYSQQQVNDAIDALDTVLTTDLTGDITAAVDELDAAVAVILASKADLVDVDAINAEIDGIDTALADAVTNIGTVTTGLATATTDIGTINAELDGIDTALVALNAALDLKANAADVYTKAETLALFMGRDPDVAMQQNTNSINEAGSPAIPGLTFGADGPIISGGTEVYTGLIGPDAIGGLDYQLAAVDYCISSLSAAVVDSVVVRLRDETGVVTSTVEDLTDRDAAGCYSIGVGAEADSYAISVTTTGLGQLVLHSMSATYEAVPLP